MWEIWVGDLGGLQSINAFLMGIKSYSINVSEANQNTGSVHAPFWFLVVSVTHESHFQPEAIGYSVASHPE